MNFLSMETEQGSVALENEMSKQDRLGISIEVLRKMFTWKVVVYEINILEVLICNLGGA